MKRFLCRRLHERSTYAHLVTCGAAIAAAAGALGETVPRWALGILVLFSLVGAIVPDKTIEAGA